jgi:hypothetical protein
LNVWFINYDFFILLETIAQDMVGGPYVMGQPAPASHLHARNAS